CDRWGGARITVCAFAVMALTALAVVWTLPLGNFWLFLGLFLVLFTAAGAGNGSTYRMIPVIFALRGRSDAAMSTGRKAAAALGLISAIGAYGGFVIPQVLNASKGATGTYDAAFYGFVSAYLLMLAVTWFFYLRRSTSRVGHV
ncbi:MFS transporter, partial [Arthrobacter sp. EH-1B-1]|nr:MFS transporter [Arthrobacter vasquezii]